MIFSRLAQVLLLLGLLPLSACTSFRNIASISELSSDESVLVGKVVMEGADVSDFMIGKLVSADVQLAYELPVKNGKLKLQRGTGRSVQGASFSKGQEVLRVAVKRQKVYLVGIHAGSTIVLVHNFRLFPILVTIDPSKNACNYIGTIALTKSGDKFKVEVRDEFAQDGKKLSELVEGCELKKNLARKTSKSDIRELANQQQ